MGLQIIHFAWHMMFISFQFEEASWGTSSAKRLRAHPIENEVMAISTAVSIPVTLLLDLAMPKPILRGEQAPANARLAPQSLLKSNSGMESVKVALLV